MIIQVLLPALILSLNVIFTVIWWCFQYYITMVSDADEFFADIVAKQKETVLQNNKCECLFITHQKTMPWRPSHMR